MKNTVGNSESSQPLERENKSAAVEKIKMSKPNHSFQLIFNQITPPANLREKFLHATFEIISENGAEALSASELIKKTKSSKGALFHHFETLDHLCIESLLYFKKMIFEGLPQERAKSLEEFLEHIMKDTVKKQSSTEYYHLANFYRDRAIRDERYRIALKETFEVSLNYYVDRVMEFLPATVSRECVSAKVLFMITSVERVCFHRLLYQTPDICQNELNKFLQDTIQGISALR